MRLDFVGLSVKDIDASAIRFPTRLSRGETLVRVGNTAVMLFLELVLDRIRRRITPEPELLDELLTLFIRFQSLESSFLLVGDDVRDIFIQPLPQCAVSNLLLTGFLVLLLCGLLLLRLVLFLGNHRQGSREKHQGSKGNSNPSSAHKTPRVRLVSIRKY